MRGAKYDNAKQEPFINDLLKYNDIDSAPHTKRW